MDSLDHLAGDGGDARRGGHAARAEDLEGGGQVLEVDELKRHESYSNKD